MLVECGNEANMAPDGCSPFFFFFWDCHLGFESLTLVDWLIHVGWITWIYGQMASIIVHNLIVFFDMTVHYLCKIYLDVHIVFKFASWIKNEFQWNCETSWVAKLVLSMVKSLFLHFSELRIRSFTESVIEFDIWVYRRMRQARILCGRKRKKEEAQPDQRDQVPLEPFWLSTMKYR